jgi:hypothetical protein
MYNITDSIRALRDAETIVASALLTNDQKARLLRLLGDSIPPSFNRDYLSIITEALEALYGNYPLTEAGPTVGQQDATPVATGPGEATETPEARPTEGLQEQAQDAGRVADGSDSGGTPTQAPAEAQKPKQGKARK